MKKRIVLAGLLVFFIIVSCAPTNSSRQREGSNVGQETHLTVQDEQRLTEEALPKMRQDYPPAKNPELQRYISDLGAKIVRANKLDGNPYRYNFTVVDVPDVNAFAMPAGTIFVTAPLIAAASSEAELAGVVSHEIGHVVARHSAERMYAMEKAQNKTWLYAAGGAVVGAAVGYGAGRAALAGKAIRRAMPSRSHRRRAWRGRRILLASKYTFLVHSREDEREADSIGYLNIVAAGYDKDEVGKIYGKTAADGKSGAGTGGRQQRDEKPSPTLLSTHPRGRRKGCSR
jgi:predicted Zn-dependent protease